VGNADPGGVAVSQPSLPWDSFQVGPVRCDGGERDKHAGDYWEGTECT
jgi:hypothetical protein